MRTKLSIVLGIALVCSGAAAAQVALVDPPDRVARLSHVEGAVSLAPAAADQWVVDAVLNRPLTGGDRVWVDAASRAELQLDTATIHLDENTSLSFVELDDAAIRLRLTDGAIVIHVRSIGAHEAVTVETNNTIVALRQAGEYAVTTDTSGQTIVKTRRGECDVSGATPQSYLVGANEQGVFAGDPLQVGWVALPPRNVFEIWSSVREDAQSRSVAARYVGAGTIGYQDLDTYGRWSYEPQFGDVWRPTTIAVRDWAPYRYGRWVWVSPWGWTWIDDARWGFAPFHYGRWAYVRKHWYWVPGPPRQRAIYAPALVAWAGDPSRGFNHVGWFPLGPRDIYLPGYRASWRHFRAINAGNTWRLDEAALTNAYHGRGSTFEYRNRSAPHALTIVSRDAFVSAKRTHGPGVHVERHAQHTWREQGRAPDLKPNRLSVLGAEPARQPPTARRARVEQQAHDARRQRTEQHVDNAHRQRAEQQAHTPPPLDVNRAALVSPVEPPAPTQGHTQRADRVSAPRHDPPAAAPRSPAEPERHSRGLLGYAKAPKQMPAASAATAIAAPTPAVPARVPVETRGHLPTAGLKAGKTDRQAAAPRAWVAAPGADGQAPASTRHGQADRAARDPGNRHSGARGAPRGGEASPRDLTQ